MTTEAATTLAQSRIRASAAAIERLLEPACVASLSAAAELLSASMRGAGKLLVFGNGGSAADASHIAAEFVGRFLQDRRALPALSLSDNASAVTAIGNDFGFERIFVRQVEAHAAAGDVALGISTSGRSANVLLGLATARRLGLATIALTGVDGGAMAETADVCICVPSSDTPRIQEAHTVVAHILCELTERDIR
jgi:D-sedoheptulose 7-phosphate isomerase